MESIPAYFLTWTTYGTWLPGDQRGWVSKWNNAPGADVCPPSVNYESLCNQRLKYPPVIFDRNQRDIVQQAIVLECQYRQWHLFAANCRTNHIHVLLQALEEKPEKVLNTLKAYATRALRKRGFFEKQTVWTPKGSIRFLDKSENIYKVIDYIQGQ